MTFIKRHNKYVIIFAILICNMSCVHEIPKSEKTLKGRNGCDLIWDIRYKNQKEIFFHNTCANQSCMVVWKSRNMLGMWSVIHHGHIPPQGELSYPVYFYDMQYQPRNKYSIRLNA